MTQSTEQDRAEFEAWQIGELRKEIGRPVNLQSDDDLRRYFLRINKSGEYYGYPEQKRFEAWQAVRRAQVVPELDIEFGMRGKNMTFQVGNQRFTLAYEPEEDGEFEFMADMLRAAISTITHGVKIDAAAPQPPEAAQHVAVDKMHANMIKMCFPFGKSACNPSMQPDLATLAAPVQLPEPQELARAFHEAYERLAPQFGYETRPETRDFDPESANGRLMIAVCAEQQVRQLLEVKGAK